MNRPRVLASPASARGGSDGVTRMQVMVVGEVVDVVGRYETERPLNAGAKRGHGGIAFMYCELKRT